LSRKSEVVKKHRTRPRNPDGVGVLHKGNSRSLTTGGAAVVMFDGLGK
jgi:hypothetical protein